MLNENQLKEIKEKLEYGEEVTITCDRLCRMEQLTRHFTGFSRIRVNCSFIGEGGKRKFVKGI